MRVAGKTAAAVSDADLYLRGVETLAASWRVILAQPVYCPRASASSPW